MKLLFVALLAVYGCSGDSKSKKRDLANKGPVSEEQKNAGAQPAAPEPSIFRLAIKNCDQLLRTMERMTGTSRLVAPVSTVYDNVKGSCPTDQSPDSFDGSQIVAINKLAMAFCSGYVTTVVKAGQITGLDLTKAPKIGITDAGLDNLYSDFFTRFYYGPRAGVPDVAKIKATIDGTLKEVRDAATTPATVVASEAIIQAACGSVLSSAPVITQ
jgi:hypothetical protein